MGGQGDGDMGDTGSRLCPWWHRDAGVYCGDGGHWGHSSFCDGTGTPACTMGKGDMAMGWEHACPHGRMGTWLCTTGTQLGTQWCGEMSVPHCVPSVTLADRDPTGLH